MKRNKQQNKLYCDNCCNPLLDVDTTQNKGLLAAKIINAGYLAKNLLLYVGKDKWCFYCNKKCQHEHFETLDISAEKVHDVSEIMGEVRNLMPSKVKTIMKNVLAFKNALLIKQKHK